MFHIRLVWLLSLLEAPTPHPHPLSSLTHTYPKPHADHTTGITMQLKQLI